MQTQRGTKVMTYNFKYTTSLLLITSLSVLACTTTKKTASTSTKNANTSELVPELNDPNYKGEFGEFDGKFDELTELKSASDTGEDDFTTAEKKLQEHEKTNKNHEKYEAMLDEVRAKRAQREQNEAKKSAAYAEQQRLDMIARQKARTELIRKDMEEAKKRASKLPEIESEELRWNGLYTKH